MLYNIISNLKKRGKTEALTLKYIRKRIIQNLYKE